MKRFLKNTFFIFLLFIAFTLTQSKVFGYNIKFRAKFNDDGTYNCTLREITQGSEHSATEYKEAKKDANGWVDTSSNKTAGWGGKGYYSSYAIRFATNVTSTYTNGFKGSDKIDDGYNAYYDYLKSGQEVDINTFDWNKFEGGQAVCVEREITPENKYKVDIGDYFYSLRYKIIKPDTERISVTDWCITDGLCKALITKYTENRCMNGTLRFSWLLRTDDSRLDANLKKNMDTAYKYYKTIVGTWWAGSRGFNEQEGWLSYSTGTYKKGASAINNFDNILILPLGDVTPRKVYVKHVDENGKLLNIQNSSQVLVDNGKYSIINSKGKQDGYQEYYEYKINQSMQISKSTQLLVNGVQYSYIGAKYAVGTDIKDANNKYNNSTNNTTSTTISTPKTNKADVMVVVFKYSKTGVSQPDPKIKLEQKDSEACDIYLAPIGSNITPYAVTNKYVATDVRYSLKIKNGEPIYVLSSFKVDKLNSFTLKSVNGTSKEKLLNTGTVSENVTIAVNNFDKDLKKFMESYNNKKLDQIPKSVVSDTKTGKSDFGNNVFSIPMDKYNGVRELYGYVSYTGFDVLKNTVIKNSSKVINDIEVNPKINVYAPLDISVKTETGKIVDHTTGSNGFIVQRDAEITITPTVTSATEKYLSHYYIILDFDADNLTSGGHIKAGTAIRVDKGKALKIKATSGTESGDIIAQVNNKIKVIGVTVNMPDKRLENQVLQEEGRVNETGGFESVSNVRYVDEGSIKIPEATCKIDEDDYADKRHVGYYCGNMFRDAYYFARVTSTSKNIGRIYDFKITDCSDINFKNVFRVTSGNSVNALTGNTYVSGDKKLYIYKGQNFLIPLSNLDITGTKAKKILPLGPYKNTNSSYVQAPKMGYRISFDLKTSGYFAYNENTERSSRKIVITPSYYYISKDGKTVIDNITLYYKDSSGKYVNFKNSNYTIYFKPNDGYRFKYNSDEAGNTKWMSSQLEPLVIGKESFELNYKMMTSSGNDFIQAWYGEFKLPNSTIAVGGGASINNPLTNGYVGVKFKIDCVDQNGVTVSYNENDKGADQLKNTTQWDYEGYLGYSGVGRDLTSKDDIKLQLEKGVYQIDTQAKYEQFKSTVVLFDLDNRAANDFE